MQLSPTGRKGNFSYTIGQSIFKGHLGYEVMAKGIPMVQQGDLVRGKILNCMTPIIRDEKVIGYIWANETLKEVSTRLSQITKQIFMFTLLIFVFLYAAVMFSIWHFNGKIDQLIGNINNVMKNPTERLSEMNGPLSSVVKGVNDLLDKVFYFKSNNEYIFNGVKSGVFAITVGGEILLANSSFFKIFEIEDTNLIAKKYSSVLPESLSKLITDAINNEDLEKSTKDFIYRGKIIEFINNGVFNEENEQIGEVFIFRDQTLLRLYERRFTDQEKLSALAEMGLNIAHEIKNPLTAVKGFSQLMVSRKIEKTKMNEYLKLMDDELNRIDKLLNDLLENGARLKLILKPVNIFEILNELVVIYKNIYQDIDFTFNADIKSNPVIIADKNKIAQLVDNLVKNSIESINEKKTNSQKTVLLNLIVDDKLVLLKIRDNGQGVPPEDITRIMTPFYTTKKDGTGLGMGQCQGIVEKHRGEIAVSSEAGVYTEVSVKFLKERLERLYETQNNDS